MTEVKTKFGSTKSVSSIGVPGNVRVSDIKKSSIYDLGALPGAESEVIGRARIKQAVAIFRYLAKRGILTHFEGVGKNPDGLSFFARECAVPDEPLLSGASDMRHTNLELLFRIRASEKFCQRVADGLVSIEDVALLPGQKLKPGVKLARPYVEATSKWYDSDVYLKKQQAAELSGLTLEQLEALYRETGGIGGLLESLFVAIGYKLFDGKLEFAFREALELFYLIDAVTFDELGLEKDGELYGKNPWRKWYERTYPEWYKLLKAAQKAHVNDKSQWPTYPGPLPRDMLLAQEVKYTRGADELEAYVSRLH